MRRTTIWAWTLALGLVGCDSTPPTPPPGAEDAELKLEIESGGGDMGGADGEPTTDEPKTDDAKADESKQEPATDEPAAKKDE